MPSLTIDFTRLDVYISAVVRTPMGGFNGSLASLPATKLGSIAIKGKLQRDELKFIPDNTISNCCVLIRCSCH